MLITLRNSPHNTRGPEYVQQCLDAVHSHLTPRSKVTLGFASRHSQVLPFCRADDAIAESLQKSLHAFYPDTDISIEDEDDWSDTGNQKQVSRSLVLLSDVFPLRRYREFSDPDNQQLADPLSGVLQILTSDDSLRVELTLRRVGRFRQKRAEFLLYWLLSRFFRARPEFSHWFVWVACGRSWLMRRLTDVAGTLLGNGVDLQDVSETSRSLTADHTRESDLAAAFGKVMRQCLFTATLRLSISLDRKTSASLAREKLRRLAAAFTTFNRRHAEWRLRRRSGSRGFILSSEEVATLWHPPTASVQTTQLGRSAFTELEPPLHLPDPSRESDVTTIGRVKFRNRNELFGIRLKDRMRHTVMVGKTGTGKSTLLYNTILSDVEQFRGVALFDPHGDLADQVLAATPKNRTRDVVLVDAGDTAFPVAFNPLDCPHRKLESRIASGIVAAFRKINPDSWGPRLEDILRNSLRLLLEKPGSTLISLQRLLSDEVYRQHMIREIRDPAIRAYWHHEFSNWSKHERTIAVSSVLNKVGPFLSNPILRNIVGQSKSRVRLREIMDDGRILIINLSKGRMGEDASSLLGSLMLTSLQIAAMSRADIAESARRSFFAYVDEFQNFATESFATILSEARKYGLSLTLAHQYIDQVDEKTRGAVFGNVENLLCFRVGSHDAEVLAEEFGNSMGPAELTRLARHTAYIRMLNDGVPQKTFTMITLAPSPSQHRNRSAVVRRTSNHRYARPQSTITQEVETTYAE